MFALMHAYICLLLTYICICIGIYIMHAHTFPTGIKYTYGGLKFSDPELSTSIHVFKF